jgi:adenosylhomocysteine nucleosidase
MPDPIAVVAAEKRELAFLHRRANPDCMFIETGEGVENAERGLRSLLQRHKVRAVVGVGYAGGLSPSLRIGDLVIAREVRGCIQAVPTAELLSAAQGVRVEGAAICCGTFITVNEVVGEARRKQRLAAQLGENEIGCVDMESSAIAQVCREEGIPFLIIRCISDVLNEDLPVDFNRCRGRDGRISGLKVVWAALRHPRAFKGLWKLRQRSCLCAEHLALFTERLIRVIPPLDL